jgi:hypothetical protein
MEKTKERYDLPSLVSCITCTSFNLWMFHGECDAFAMVVNFINNLWEHVHVLMGIFEMHITTSVAMANQVKVLRDSFGLLDEVIVYVKDEGSKFKFLDFNVNKCCYLFSISII